MMNDMISIIEERMEKTMMQHAAKTDAMFDELIGMGLSPEMASEVMTWIFQRNGIKVVFKVAK